MVMVTTIIVGNFSGSSTSSIIYINSDGCVMVCSGV